MIRDIDLNINKVWNSDELTTVEKNIREGEKKFKKNLWSMF